ncbi:hypothetical protein X781_23850 [Mannheimia sp. USDA-ARS-USMARC-1261]|nr:hypothetical protein X781_23850 [Mannheimia sp. USDA-ARS-USMARC-1261]
MIFGNFGIFETIQLEKGLDYVKEKFLMSLTADILNILSYNSHKSIIS